MQIIADVSKISKAVQRNITFILNVLSESSIHFMQLSIVLAWHFQIKWFLSKKRLRNYAGTCKGICSYNLVYNFLIKFLLLKSLVFVEDFLNAFCHRHKAFPKGSSQNEIVPLLVVFHLPYSKYKGVKICFYSYRYQNQNFSLESHLCCLCSTRVSLVLHWCRQCRTRVARVWHSFCKLGQIFYGNSRCKKISQRSVFTSASMFY